MLKAGKSPKTVRNVLTFAHSVFEHAVDEGWCAETPCAVLADRAGSTRATSSRICSFSR